MFATLASLIVTLCSLRLHLLIIQNSFQSERSNQLKQLVWSLFYTKKADNRYTSHQLPMLQC